MIDVSNITNKTSSVLHGSYLHALHLNDILPEYECHIMYWTSLGKHGQVL